MAAPCFNVYVGSETGLFKGIDVLKCHWENLNTLKSADKSKEICSLNWIHDSETEICVGLKNKCVINFNTSTRELSDPICLDGSSGNLRNVVTYGDSHVTATDTGIVNVWKGDENVAEINSGDHLHCMSQNKTEGNVIGTGGKEADFKLWDISDPEKATFTAKNVKNDWLNLRVPVWITGIGFLSDNKVVTATGHHQVRMYDPKAQRRPVMDMTFDEYPLTALTVRNDSQVVVGNTQGKMALFDIRKGKLVHIFKGFAGSIRSLYCHPNLPLVASCGLDRFLRIHDLNTKQMIHKVYLKSRLNCVLMTKKWADNEEEENVEADRNVESVDVGDEDHDTDESDELWDKMEVVKTKTVKKSDVQEKPEKRKHVEKNVGKTSKKKKIQKHCK